MIRLNVDQTNVLGMAIDVFSVLLERTTVVQLNGSIDRPVSTERFDRQLFPVRVESHSSTIYEVRIYIVICPNTHLMKGQSAS
jgi:hypothetical protein